MFLTQTSRVQTCTFLTSKCVDFGIFRKIWFLSQTYILDTVPYSLKCRISNVNTIILLHERRPTENTIHDLDKEI